MILFSMYFIDQVLNGTLRYDQTQSTTPIVQTLNYLVPATMNLHGTPSATISEGRAFDAPPVLRTFTTNSEWVQNLGTESDPWIVEATLSGGDPAATLVGKYSRLYIIRTHFLPMS